MSVACLLDSEITDTLKCCTDTDTFQLYLEASVANIWLILTVDLCLTSGAMWHCGRLFMET